MPLKLGQSVLSKLRAQLLIVLALTLAASSCITVVAPTTVPVATASATATSTPTPTPTPTFTPTPTPTAIPTRIPAPTATPTPVPAPTPTPEPEFSFDDLANLSLDQIATILEIGLAVEAPGADCEITALPNASHSDLEEWIEEDSDPNFRVYLNLDYTSSGSEYFQFAYVFSGHDGYLLVVCDGAALEVFSNLD